MCDDYDYDPFTRLRDKFRSISRKLSLDKDSEIIRLIKEVDNLSKMFPESNKDSLKTISDISKTLLTNISDAHATEICKRFQSSSELVLKEATRKHLNDFFSNFLILKDHLAMLQASSIDIPLERVKHLIDKMKIKGLKNALNNKLFDSDDSDSDSDD
jgi:hypothetical protein